MCGLLSFMRKSFLERLLEYFNITFDDYKKITRKFNLDNFYENHSFKDVENAVELVNNSIINNDKIIIYGDYDADGIMGTSILVKMFQYLDRVVDYYIPSRYIDGYGLNMNHVIDYVKKGYNLVITVDNGISAFEPIKYLRDNGVKVLVLDHHQVQETIPDANAICHPILSNFGDVTSSGAFTAFMFSIALLKRSDKYLSTLAAISVISDMMPLCEYNRYLLRTVFDNYIIGEFRSIDLLADSEALNENVIGMKIAPKINSIGRLIEDESVNKIVEYFVSDDEQFILNYFSYITDVNEQRKILSKETSDSLSFDNDEKAIILYGDFKEGLIGLIANSIVTKYHVPTIVFTNSGENELKGSARAPEGFNIVESFNSLSDLLIAFGGHASAGGCSLKKENFELFKQKFMELANAKPIMYVEKPSIEVFMNELTNENYELLNSFGPFGEAWPMPVLKLSHVKTSTLMFSRDGKHILTSFGYSLRLVGFNFSKEDVLQKEYIDIFGSIKKSFFRGNSYIEFLIKEIR